jgi:hypothetical protein
MPSAAAAASTEIQWCQQNVLPMKCCCLLLLLPAAACCCCLCCCCCFCCCCCSSFDLIFLDANKDGYQSYYNTIMDQHLLAAGGLLVVDNTLMKVSEGGGEGLADPGHAVQHTYVHVTVHAAPVV